ncbi:MAG: tRNA pseudouridine(38-40) synthase TruA [Spirochaetales bacterium]|nr:tRNA pseudouridine(38-40) synthase TruA [Spirochaetales bacterium]
MKSLRLKIVLSYIGTDFYGWQIQNKGRTVQGVLEEGLARMHKHSVRVVAAGRTDSGVHANGQVCHFDTELDIPEKKFKMAINSFIPNDISITSCVYVGGDFHARFSAKRRVYKYYFTDDLGYNIFNSQFCVLVKTLPEIEVLNACARNLEGIHDFTTFTCVGDKSKSRVREVYSAVIYREGNLMVFKIEGSAFLWKMVRSIVGTILKYSSMESGAAEFKKALESKDRTLAGTTAPAKGLFFHKVYY